LRKRPCGATPTGSVSMKGDTARFARRAGGDRRRTRDGSPDRRGCCEGDGHQVLLRAHGTRLFHPARATTEPAVSGPEVRRPSRSARPASACSRNRCCSSVSPINSVSIRRCLALLTASIFVRQRSMKPRSASRSALMISRSDPVGSTPDVAGTSERVPPSPRSRPAARPGGVLAGDDVLVGVVEDVAAYAAGPGFVPAPERRLVLVDRPQQHQEIAGLHALCFSLQVIQTRVQGIAASRAGAIGSLQSRQIP